MMKPVMGIMLAWVLVAVAGEYQSLDKQARNEFQKSYKAIKIAYQERNYGPILRFAPIMQKKYESILLDPSCKKIRPMYNELGKIICNVTYEMKVDSLYRLVSGCLDRGDMESALLHYDAMLSLVKEDSMLVERKRQYDSLVRIVTSKKSMHSYSFLASLRHVDQDDLFGLRNAIHEVFDERIAQLSASMSCDSIIQFRKSFPGVRPDDMAALLDRARMAQRRSLLRQPSFLGYAEFRELFGNDDKLKQCIKKMAFKMAFSVAADPAPLREYIKLFPNEEQEIWNGFEDALYNDWRSKQTSIAAATYLRFFPNGRYTGIVCGTGQANSMAEIIGNGR